MASIPTRLSSYAPSGAVLSKQEIKATLAKDRDEFMAKSTLTEGYRLLLSNFKEAHLEPASYDASVGNSAFFPKRINSGAPYIDRDKEPAEFETLVREAKAVALKPAMTLVVPPGEIVIVRTNEMVGIPNAITALVTTKVNHAFQGIVQPTSRIDPGFVGFLYVPLFNLGRNDLELQVGEKLCNLVFMKVTSVETGRGPLDPDAIRKSVHVSRSQIQPADMTEEQLLAELPKHGIGFEYLTAYLEKKLGKKAK